ncbi:GNAT family N-acetyltransferase [Cerasicoccus fimbriatus]|uniref:GNAT family N-acetyltransferase n=1 Tax=Cerasicoccus fimbriatus TaxID=3014554 RepID=UPI0022B48A5B|nr:GNAT family N-acetyltransferase [Cerasicoccus sp. TK19100]
MTTQSSDLTWVCDDAAIDWHELSELYRIAPLGEKPSATLKLVFGNSRYKCFVFRDGKIIAVGRALADGADCSYICDVAVHPDCQGEGLGKRIIEKLVELSRDHKKIILYANPGAEPFYKKLGFLPMNTAMAIFSNQAEAVQKGILNGSTAKPT